MSVNFHASAAVTPGKNFRSHYIEGSVYPTAVLEDLEKRKIYCLKSNCEIISNNVKENDRFVYA
jgi:hypothetical protein